MTQREPKRVIPTPGYSPHQPGQGRSPSASTGRCAWSHTWAAPEKAVSIKQSPCRNVWGLLATGDVFGSSRQQGEGGWGGRSPRLLRKRFLGRRTERPSCRPVRHFHCAFVFIFCKVFMWSSKYNIQVLIYRGQAIRIEEALKKVSFCCFWVERETKGKLCVRKGGKMHRQYLMILFLNRSDI